MPALHARLLADVIEIGEPLPLVLTGGYAVQAHEIVSRLSKDLDFATDSQRPLPDIADVLVDGLTARGWRVQVIETSKNSARLQVNGAEGEECEVDVLREFFTRKPAQMAYGPVLAEPDVLGTKMRALSERGVPRDLIDIHSASRWWSCSDLESLGRAHSRGRFTLEGLQNRLEAAQWYGEEEFTEYGLTPDEVRVLYAWATAWAEDLALRLHTGESRDEQEPGDESWLYDV
ncbi:hypothetical protein SRB5_46440 [Streptomyces sp. RB5]|uniref:Uncharacterized protein n=1 Tax=Streptomyces smaragdinus TaxID=2585196 RepID=A0A7K0CLW8_9ACTN|nr:hypothetical protein [Streptomyces smaragdinus]